MDSSIGKWAFVELHRLHEGPLGFPLQRDASRDPLGPQADGGVYEGTESLKKGDIPMRLTPPKTIVWWISLILVVLALLAFFIASLGFQYYALWLALASAVLMLLATLLKGL
jgi:hypothetical protein